MQEFMKFQNVNRNEKMKTAVVEAAKFRGLEHEEMHSKVDYIVAHGISDVYKRQIWMFPMFFRGNIRKSRFR